MTNLVRSLCVEGQDAWLLSKEVEGWPCTPVRTEGAGERPMAEVTACIQGTAPANFEHLGPGSRVSWPVLCERV